MKLQLGSRGRAAYFQAQATSVFVRTGEQGVQAIDVLRVTLAAASLRQSSLLQTDGSEPNKLVIMNADVVKVLMQTVSQHNVALQHHCEFKKPCACSLGWHLRA